MKKQQQQKPHNNLFFQQSISIWTPRLNTVKLTLTGKNICNTSFTVANLTVVFQHKQHNSPHRFQRFDDTNEKFAFF